MGLTEFYSILFFDIIFVLLQVKNNYVLPPSHPSHYFFAAGGNRPRHCEHLRKLSAVKERNMPR